MKETTIVVEGTGALLPIDLGFIPDEVIVANVITRTELKFNRFDTENTLGTAVAAAGTKAKATAGIVLPDHLSEDKAFDLAAAAIVNVNGNDLLVTGKQINYVYPLDHTPRFKDATESTGGPFEAPVQEPAYSN